MQYVGETAQQLIIRFATHRASMSGKVKSNSCKRLAEHFSAVVCKNTRCSVHGKAMVKLVVVLLTLVKQFFGGREKQNECLS